MGLIVIPFLVAIEFMQYRMSVLLTQEAVLKHNLSQLRNAIDEYHQRTGEYPASLETLVGYHYIRAIPKDPFTQLVSWQIVPATNGIGIFDVKSNAMGEASDGSLYADW